MSAHTPGPWTIHGSFEGGAPIKIYTTSGMLVLILEPENGEWTEQEIADARLIAAAPDLLAALVRYGKHEKDCRYRCDCGLQAAIAKVTGRPPAEVPHG